MFQRCVVVILFNKYEALLLIVILNSSKVCRRVLRQEVNLIKWVEGIIKLNNLNPVSPGGHIDQLSEIKS